MAFYSISIFFTLVFCFQQLEEEVRKGLYFFFFLSLFTEPQTGKSRTRLRNSFSFKLRVFLVNLFFVCFSIRFVEGFILEIYLGKKKKENFFNS